MIIGSYTCEFHSTSTCISRQLYGTFLSSLFWLYVPLFWFSLTVLINISRWSSCGKKTDTWLINPAYTTCSSTNDRQPRLHDQTKTRARKRVNIGKNFNQFNRNTTSKECWCCSVSAGCVNRQLFTGDLCISTSIICHCCVNALKNQLMH